MATNNIFKKYIFVAFACLLAFPDVLYAQAKPIRDAKKDISVSKVKATENNQKSDATLQNGRVKKKVTRRKPSPPKNTIPDKATYLQVDQQTALNHTFSYIGGSKYFSVKTDGKTWDVTNVPMWCTIRKFSDSFTISCDKNPYHDDRECRIWVSSDNKNVGIDITQRETPLRIEAKFENASLTHNVYKNWKDNNCLEINADVVITGARGQKCLIVAHFYDDYGYKLKADSKYPQYAVSGSGELYAATQVVPISDYPQRHSVSFYLPNNAMHFGGKKRNLQCRLYLYCAKTGTYIDGASYKLNFKAKNKKGKIKTKKRK